jgi:aldo/keto reductase family protein
MRKVADGPGVSLAQVAIAWLMARPAVSPVILGARSMGQLTGNMAAAGLRLTPEETQLLEEASEPPAPGLPLRRARPVPARPPHPGREDSERLAGAQRQLMQTWLCGSMPASSQTISDRGVGKGRGPGRGVVIMMLPAADAGDLVICGGGAAGALAGGCVRALMGAIGVAAAVPRGDRLASRRPGVMFAGAPAPGGRGRRGGSGC